MKRICQRFLKRVLLTTVIIHLAMLSFATIYYVSNTGNDSNNGLSEITPWKTISKVNNLKFVAGDIISFKKGNTWRERLIVPSSGSMGNPITITSYGTGSKPIITTPTISATWVLSGSVYHTTLAISGYAVIWEDNKSIKKATTTSCTDGNWFTSGGVFYYKPTSGTPNNHVLNYANVTSETHLTTEGINVSDKSYITISNIEFNTLGIGVVSYDTGVGTESVKVENCDFISSWRGVFFMPNANANKNAIVTNNYFKWNQCAVGMYTNTAPGYGTYNTVGTNTNPTVSYNEMYECGTTDGTTHWNQFTDFEAIGIQNVSGASVHHNYIHGGYQIGFEIYNQATRISSNNLVYNNRIENNGTKTPIELTGSAGHGGFNNNKFYYNVISNTANSYSVAWDQGVSAKQMNYFLNNTFVGIYSQFKLYTINPALYLTIKNNIIYQVGSYAFRCDGNPTQLVMNNNIYKQVTPAASPFYFNGAWRSLANMQGLGFEVNGKTNDPLFISSSDYQLKSTSPAINAGENVGLSSDYKGNPIVGLPDAGAFEYGSITDVIAPGAPTSVVATAGNASASVTFVAPLSNGGSVITGYTVTSIPAGGTDANAGSTSLTHIITGLTNGISYTFTVKATNSVGTSVASVASNSVTPKAPVATGFLFTGPSSGNVNSPSANFTVTPNNPFTGTITITPTGIGSTGLSAKVLSFSNSSTAQTFTITPTVAGSITLTPTNNSTLTNPANLIYAVNAVVPNAPTSVVATSGDASASVTFIAPTNTGGSAITGYTVTSIPAGGTDINAGSTSLTHIITGLTNGTSYTFTVKATNSVGSSVASVASNSIENIIIKQGEIIPSHFTTVWDGLNGLNHMNINVVSALLEDFSLSADDEIAVFSGSACVGASKLTQSIIPSDNTTFVTILASQNDGSGNGFNDNDTIVFKIWNNKTQNELQVNGVVYRNDISTWKTNGRYSPGATTVVEIASYQVYTQSIELLKGYNMISTYVSAQNPNASVVTKTLVDQGNLIKMQDETGNSLENWGDFGGWINKLGSLEKTEGYKIQVANNCTLQVTGKRIAMPLDINLKAGWNIISFPRTDVVNAINVVQALIDQNKLVKVQDEAGNSIENWGLFGGWKNGIGNFIPGKAYKVKMSVDAILSFQESYPKSAIVLANSEPTEYYHSSVEGNGTDHMNINITGLNSIGISVGDELAAFDGEICVGTIKITEANLLTGSACLVTSFSTDDQNPNGFKVGSPIKISAWSKLSGDESIVITEVITGQMRYEKNASVLLKMKSATIATVVTNLDDAVKIDVFPNPCQDKVTVRFSDLPEANSRIEISDISGRKLISRHISGTSEEFNLESFTPGLYLVKSILGSSKFVQKLIVNK